MYFVRSNLHCSFLKGLQGCYPYHSFTYTLHAATAHQRGARFSVAAHCCLRLAWLHPIHTLIF